VVAPTTEKGKTGHKQLGRGRGGGGGGTRDLQESGRTKEEGRGNLPTKRVKKALGVHSIRSRGRGTVLSEIIKIVSRTRSLNGKKRKENRRLQT